VENCQLFFVASQTASYIPVLRKASILSRLTLFLGILGNPLFVRQHIITLYDKKLIRVEDGEIVWDLDHIEKSHDIARSLNSMTFDGIRRLPESAQLGLQLCAFIGSRATYEVIEILAREICVEKSYGARDLLSPAIEDGLLIESQDGSSVSFVHDCVQTAAYSLLEDENQEQFHCKLGQILKAAWPGTDSWSSDVLFTVANQFGRGHKFVEECDRMEVISILVRATEECRMVADFKGAHWFYDVAVEKFLVRINWERNHRLCCKVYLNAAENALWAGVLHETDRWLNYLGQYIEGSRIDELRSLWVRLNWMATTRGGEAAIDYGLQKLNSLVGIKIVQNNIKMRTMVSSLPTMLNASIFD
jgi:predicted ATPase